MTAETRQRAASHGARRAPAGGPGCLLGPGLLLAVLVGPLLWWSSASAQGTAQGPAFYQEDSASRAPSNFQLRGTLISPSGRSALVNGGLAEVGDRVAGARILAIDEGAVRILIGARELSVNVGSTVAVDGVARQPAGEPDWAVRRQRDPEPGIATEPVTPREPLVAGSGPDQARPVREGETLSGIAWELRPEGVTLNQTMMALFDINPQAFGGNINLLYEGAVLRIPVSAELGIQDPGAAAAEVLRQNREWLPDAESDTRLAAAGDQPRYGPVGPGETLSAIAQRLLPEDVTLDQMMLALFQTNPQAFGDNVNVLYAGATLRVPADDVVRGQSAETARNEVLRQTRIWRAAAGQPAAPLAAQVRRNEASHHSRFL